MLAWHVITLASIPSAAARVVTASPRRPRGEVGLTTARHGSRPQRHPKPPPDRVPAALPKGAARRALQQVAEETIVSTTDCANVRAASSFRARLDLYYLYRLECHTNNNSSNSSSSIDCSALLYGNSSDAFAGAMSCIDRAIATSIVKVLNQCDDALQQPEYAVQMSPDDQIATSQSGTQ
jgi:hypothetical protein